MKTRHPRSIKSIAAISILVSALISLSTVPASAEAMVHFRNTEQIFPSSDDISITARRKLLVKLDEKGDLLIQCGCARLAVAYNSPADQLKPGEQQRSSQRDELSAINGISLTASLPF